MGDRQPDPWGIRATIRPRIRPSDVAMMLGISTRKVQEMAASGKIPGAMKVDTLWTFDRGKIEEFMADGSCLVPVPRKSPAPPKTPRPKRRPLVPPEQSAADIVAASKQIEGPNCGIYFLIDREKIVYIGQAVDIVRRLMAHFKEKQFDSWHWIPCPKRKLNEWERHYINQFMPPLNRDPITMRTRLAKVLADV